MARPSEKRCTTRLDVFEVTDCLFIFFVQFYSNFGVNMQELGDLATFLNIPPAHLSVSGNLAVNISR